MADQERIVREIWPEADDWAVAEVITAAHGDAEALRQIATAAAERYRENLGAQADGTANALGVKPPEGWSGRYDGDY